MPENSWNKLSNALDEYLSRRNTTFEKWEDCDQKGKSWLGSFSFMCKNKSHNDSIMYEIGEYLTYHFNMYINKYIYDYLVRWHGYEDKISLEIYLNTPMGRVCWFWEIRCPENVRIEEQTALNQRMFVR